MSEEQIDLLEDWPAGQPPGSPAAVPSPSEYARAAPDLTPVLLTRTDLACNMHRFYSLEFATSLFGERGVVRHWGRIGTSGRIRTDWYNEPHKAESAFQDLLRAKQRGGYTPCGPAKRIGS